MDKIRYNDEQEAFEIDYELWGQKVTVLFYMEEQMKIDSAFVDMDEDGVVLGATVVTQNGALGEGVMVEVLEDGALEVSAEGKLL